MKKVSVIVPCYNEMESIPIFYKEIKKVFDNLPYHLELIFVDDGSRDDSLSIMKDLSKDKDVHYISFSRNFGKEAAMWAGLNYAHGDFVTVMDVDLQDPPYLLEEMLYYINEKGYDIVGTRRVTRKGEPKIRSFFARCFYKIINKMSKVEMVDGARDFRLMTRDVVNSILTLREYHRYSKGLFSFVGYKTKWLEYENIERVAGTTKWSFRKLFVYAIEGIVAFTTVPLTISFVFGIIFMLVAFILLIAIIIRLISSPDLSNSNLLLYFIIFLISSMQMFVIGIIGEYLSKTYMEVKERPIYIVREKNIEEYHD